MHAFFTWIQEGISQLKLEVDKRLSSYNLTRLKIMSCRIFRLNIQYQAQT